MREPPVSGTEAETLLGGLERQRSVIAWKCGGLDQPVTTMTSPDGEHPSLRRVLVDVLEEYARHAGHADIVRESVDGLVGEDPP